VVSCGRQMAGDYWSMALLMIIIIISGAYSMVLFCEGFMYCSKKFPLLGAKVCAVARFDVVVVDHQKSLLHNNR
jgi:hypothetical protein